MSHRDWRLIEELWWDPGEVEAAPPRPMAPGKRTLTMGLMSQSGTELPPVVQRKQDPAIEAQRAEHAAQTDSWMAVAVRPDLHPAPAVIQRKRTGSAPMKEDQSRVPQAGSGRPTGDAPIQMKVEASFTTGQKLSITGDTSIGSGSFSIVVTRDDGEALHGEMLDLDGNPTGEMIEAKKSELILAEPYQAHAEGSEKETKSPTKLADEYAPAGVLDVDPEAAAEYMNWPSLNKMGRVFASNAKLLPIASAKARPVATLKPRELLFVEKVSGNGWLYVTTTEGASGYLADFGFHQQKPKTVFVNNISPADPAADIYQIKSGDTALGMAQKHYSSYVRPGHDARYFIGVLAWANGRGSDSEKGIFHKEGRDVKNWEANWFSASSWEKCAVVANRWIWVPTASFAKQLESEITDGSLTNGAWSTVKDVAEAAAGGAAFVAGLVAGALKSLWDLVTGLVDLGKILVKTLKSLITGNIVSDVSELVSKLADLDIGDLILEGFGKLAENWNQEGLLDRWYFRGKVIGYIVAEILMLILTGGAAVAKWAGRFGKLGAALSKSATVTRFANGAQKVVDKGGDAIRYAKKALKGNKAEKAGDAGKAIDKAGDAGKAEVRSGVQEDPGPLMRGGKLSPRQEALSKGLDSTEGMGKHLLEVGKREVTATDLAALTKHSGVEHALVILKDNRRVLARMPSYKGGNLPANTKTLLMHSHPCDRGNGMAKFISAQDIEAIKFLNQKYSYMVTVDGTVYRFTHKTVPMTIGEVVRRPHPIYVWEQK